MKRLFASLAAIFLLPLAACADAKAPPRSADPALWVVEDADTTIYLFGTVHMMQPGTLWFDDEVKAAFDRSSELVTEVVEPDAATMAAEVARLAFNANGPRISESLTEKDRARYFAALRDAGIPAAQIDLFDPWLAAVQLSLVPVQRLGYTQEAGVEAVLEKAASVTGKRREGLETVPQQLGYFDNLSRPLQIAFLNSTVAELPKAQRQFTRLIANWSRGRVDALAREMNGSLEKTPELARVLLHERNLRWADWIATRMDRPGTLFVAVGAGHLAGDNSVQQALVAHGYAARRLGKADFGLPR